MYWIVGIAFLVAIGVRAHLNSMVRVRELGRMRDSTEGSAAGFKSYLSALSRALAFSAVEDDDWKLEAKLKAAGLGSDAGRGQYLFLRLISGLAFPLIVVAAYQSLSAYYATVTTITSLGLVVVLPQYWLKLKIERRKEAVRRELPLFLDLTNLATSAGLDVSAAIDSVIQALEPEYPSHPLVEELSKARWLSNRGYTWGESLERVSKKLDDEGVTRAMRSLRQAIEQGGNRISQISGIAEDAQRSFYASLDKRLAAVPFKALMVTLVLFLTYFTVLLAPAAVGVSAIHF